MTVERVDYYSDEEYEHAAAWEEVEMRNGHQPDVCPCFKCSNPMYLISNIPEQNLCGNCKDS